MITIYERSKKQTGKGEWVIPYTRRRRAKMARCSLPPVARVGGAFGVVPADFGTDLRLAPARAPAGPERLAHLAGRFGINLPQALLLAWAHLLCAGGAKQRQRGQGVLLAIYPAVGALLLAEDVLPQCGILVAEFFSTVMSIYKGIEVGG